jgi:L-galactose dehydrogenase
MERVRLGRTGLNVSVACLGCGGHSLLGITYGARFHEAVKVVRTAIEHGVDFIDTASAYGTERIVGAATKACRDRMVISTKAPLVRHSPLLSSNEFITGSEFIEHVNQSLMCLGSDYIDIQYVHAVQVSQYDYCMNEIVPALEHLKDQGKIRFTGISERFDVDTRHEMLERALVDDYFDAMMIGVNFINQTALRTVLPRAAQQDVGVQAMYAVRGKLATTGAANALIAEAVALGEVDADEVSNGEPLSFLLAPDVAGSLPEACYRFDRHLPGVSVVLTGTGRIDHLRENLKSINARPLPSAVLHRLRRVFSRVESVTGE